MSPTAFAIDDHYDKTYCDVSVFGKRAKQKQ